MTKRSLSEPHGRLVQMVQQINFGRIEQLRLRGGEPVFEPPPRVLETVKLGGHNGPRPEINIRDYTLKREWVEMFDHFESIGDGTVQIIEIVHGLPFLFEIERRIDD